MILAAVSCSDNGIVDPDPALTVASVLAVDGIGGPIAMNGSTSLVVEVRNNEQMPVQGVTVTFTSSGVQHTLSATTAVAASNGRASITVTAGSEAGVIEVRASAGGASPVIFNITVEADTEATTLAKVSGDGQALDCDEASAALVVQVNDQNGNAMAGVTMAFAGSGVAHSLSAESATTAANGRASVTVTAGSVASTVQVNASVGGLAAVSFTATVADGDAELSFLAPQGLPRGMA